MSEAQTNSRRGAIIAITSGKAVGIEITIYNPNLDADGSAGRGLANALAKGLTQSVLP